MTAYPYPTSPGISSKMRQQASRSTSPEVVLRRELHRRGLRYRIQQQLHPGVRRTADIVFGPSRVVVDVRGCYWHACPARGTRPLRTGSTGTPSWPATAQEMPTQNRGCGPPAGRSWSCGNMMIPARRLRR